MERGTKLYRCWNVRLETVRLVEKSIAPGATRETLLVREQDGQLVRCSVDMYHQTEREAWAAELKLYEEGVVQQREHLKKMQKLLELTEATIVLLKDRVANS